MVRLESWESPVARDQGITFLPQLWLYVDGKLVTKSTPRVLALID